MADKKNAVAELFEQGKTSGKLTTQEINDAIEDLDYDVDQVEELYESLKNMNIEVVETYNADLTLDFPHSDPENVEAQLQAEGVSICLLYTSPVFLTAKRAHLRQLRK